MAMEKKRCNSSSLVMAEQLVIPQEINACMKHWGIEMTLQAKAKVDLSQEVGSITELLYWKSIGIQMLCLESWFLGDPTI